MRTQGWLLVASTLVGGCGGGARPPDAGGSTDSAADQGGEAGPALRGAVTASSIGWARMIGDGTESSGVVQWAHHLADGSFMIGGAPAAPIELFGSTQADPTTGVAGPKYVAKLDALGRLVWVTSLGSPADSAWLGAALLGDGSTAVLGRAQSQGDQLQILPPSGSPPLTVRLPLPCQAIADGLDGTILAVGQYAVGNDLDPGPGTAPAIGSGGFVLVLSAAGGAATAIHLYPGAAWLPASGMARDPSGVVVIAGPPPGAPGQATLVGLDLTTDTVVADFHSTDTFVGWALRDGGRAAVATTSSRDATVNKVVDVDIHTGAMLTSFDSPGDVHAQGVADRQGQSLLWSNISGPTGIPELGQLRTGPGPVLIPDWEWLLVAPLQPFYAVLADPDGTVLLFGTVRLQAGESTASYVWPPAAPFVAPSDRWYYYLERIGP